jgi:ABC-type sugar transport system ATPase subunit
MGDTALLHMQDVCKSFPGVQALDAVTLEVGHGEILGLIGENGAGKSTLMKILSGVYAMDSGAIYLDGQPVQIHNPHQGQQLGISIIYQEFNLMPNLSVMENIFVGREFGRYGLIDRATLRRQTQVLLDRLGVHLSPDSIVRDLSVAEQQMVEIAKALSLQVRVIIMDEPTSALSETEVQHLLAIMRDLKREGIGVIFISHRLEEVLDICDRITVLRDGKNVGSVDASRANQDHLIRMMVGRPRSELFHSEERFNAPLADQNTAAAQDVVLEVRDLTRRGTAMDAAATVLDNVSFDLRRGEILGLAGLVGAGRTETARAIFGADRFDSGEIRIEGQLVAIDSPIDAIQHGIGFVPEDRKEQGLVLGLTVRENVALPNLDSMSRFGFVRFAQEAQKVKEYVQALQIRTPSLDKRVLNLSGGNQQKVVISKWLMLQPRILIMDEPTRGIDVGAKAEIYRLMNQLVESGVSIIMISSELPEVIAMSDRVVCMARGRVTGILTHAEATPELVMRYCTLQPGQTPDATLQEGVQAS